MHSGLESMVAEKLDIAGTANVRVGGDVTGWKRAGGFLLCVFTLHVYFVIL